MLDIQIVLDKEEYKPGDSVKGQVRITSDEVQSYEALRLDFIGVMLSRVIQGSGKHRRIYEVENPIIDESHNLVESLELQSGLNSFDFTLQIPNAAPGSYHGHNGWIQYAATVVLEKKNWPDPKKMQPIHVVWLFDASKPQSKPIQIEKTDEDYTPLVLDLPSNVLELGKDFSFKLRISDKQKLREVRAFIIYKEQVAPRGIREEYLDKLGRWSISESELIRNSWTDVRISSSTEWPFPFMSELIWTQYVLRVEIDVPFRFDLVVEVPLQMFYPFEPVESTSEIEPIFEWEK